MLSVEFHGQAGVLVAETSVVGSPLVLWIVRLNNGQLVEAPMSEFVIQVVSVLDGLKRTN